MQFTIIPNVSIAFVNEVLTVLTQQFQRMYKMFSFVFILLQQSGYMITIELLCQHQPHRCRCNHDKRTQVERQEVTNELIKHNPALLKYFGKRVQNHITKDTQINLITSTKQIEEPKIDQPYRSIVQQKGLNYILTNNYVNTAIYKTQKQEIINQNNNLLKDKNLQQPKVVQKSPQTHPKNHEYSGEQQRKQTSKQKQIKKYHKDLKNQSRYLSDTAFRKYFNRQCFQNYGRNNTHNKVDGFVYGNYMKTFNINPHTGENMPINQQTFYHALVSGSPQKYQLYNKQVKLGLTQQRLKARQNQKSLEKQKLNVQKMLEDNLKHSRLEHKYQHIKLKQNKEASKYVTGSISPKNTLKVIKQANHQQEENKSKAPSQLQINTRKHFNEEKSPNKKSVFSPKNEKIVQSKYKATVDQLKPNITSIIVESQPQKLMNQNSIKRVSNLSSIHKQIQPRVSFQGSCKSPTHLSCNHETGHNSVECACCVNKMKQFIIQLSQKDPDLADRIVNSAKKTTLYKNFALNNFQNAAMNPRNYRSIDGKLNVYEKG